MPIAPSQSLVKPVAQKPSSRSRGGFPIARRKGRTLALQVLYEVDLTGHGWQRAVELQAANTGASQAAVTFAEGCIEGVMGHREALDRLIERFAPAWPLSQLSAVDRNILRLALYELRFAATEPPKAVINEAVELAKTFGGETSPRFVNGVLGSAFAEEPGGNGTGPTTLTN